MFWAIYAMYAFLRLRDVLDQAGIRDGRAVEGAVASNTAATKRVDAEVERLASETARAQRLAVWVGVGTAVLGALLGGFAGAVAARIVGA